MTFGESTSYVPVANTSPGAKSLLLVARLYQQMKEPGAGLRFATVWLGPLQNDWTNTAGAVGMILPLKTLEPDSQFDVALFNAEQLNAPVGKPVAVSDTASFTPSKFKWVAA